MKVDITAQNQFTEDLVIPDGGVLIVDDTSSMSMTVVLQVKIGGSYIDTGVTATAEGLTLIADGCGLTYRAGVKTGGYTSGNATVHLLAKPRIM